MTYWHYIGATHAFPGKNCEHLVDEPEARAVLAQYEDRVPNYEVER